VADQRHDEWTREEVDEVIDSADPGLVRLSSGFEDAPLWYWRVAGLASGWQSEVAFWLGLAAAGFVGGCVVGRLA
jgi:hypothetical protein